MEMLNGGSTCPEEEKKIKGEHKGVEIEVYTHKERKTKDGTHLKTVGRNKVKKSR
jgi:hypothetical protein